MELLGIVVGFLRYWYPGFAAGCQNGAMAKSKMKQPTSLSPSEQLMWKIYAGASSAVAAWVASRVSKGAWKVTTGEQPPRPDSPRTPAGQALAWTVLSTVLVSVAGVLANRFAQSRFVNSLGKRPQD